MAILNSVFRRSLTKFITKMLQRKIIAPTLNKPHTGTVIFFHGSGDTGDNLIEWVRFLLGRNMEFPHIKIVYPTAPLQPYTPMGGMESNVWFDRKEISIESPESRKSLGKIYEHVNDLIKEETDNGIPAERIIVGGFSMGGALALHAAYHLNPNLGGVFAMSSFLNRRSIVYEQLKTQITGIKLPELLMFHGGLDTLVPLDWGRETFDNLTGLGVRGKFIPLKKTVHELKTDELRELENWIKQKIPQIDLQNKL